MALSYRNAALGTLSGATSGAQLGNAVPGIGTAIGAGIGAGIGGLTGLFSGEDNALAGSPDRYRQMQRYSPQQLQQYQQLAQMGQQNQQNPYAGFEPIQQEYQNYYNQELVPQLTNRFTSDTGGARLSSPNFASQLGQAGTGLTAMLAAAKARYGQQQQGFGLDQSRLGLSPQSDNILERGYPGLLEQGAQRAGEYLTSKEGVDLLGDLFGQGADLFNKGPKAKQAKDDARKGELKSFAKQAAAKRELARRELSRRAQAQLEAMQQKAQQANKYIDYAFPNLGENLGETSLSAQSPQETFGQGPYQRRYLGQGI